MVADSGVTCHMFPIQQQCRSYRLIYGYFVTAADHAMVPAAGEGDVDSLPNVLHIPTRVYDLMSEWEWESESELDSHSR